MEMDELTNQFEKDNYQDDIQDAIQKVNDCIWYQQAESLLVHICRCNLN